MNRAAAIVILLLLAGATTRTLVTGQYVSYVKAGLWPLLVISVVLLALFATAKGHQPKVAWLLVLPVLALLVVAPKSLGSYAAVNAGTVLTESDEYPPLPDGDPVEVKIFDYASRAVFDEGRTLRDRRVRLVGFTSTGPNGERLLVRMILTCCAADGRPVKIGMRNAEPLPDDTWIEVVGSYVDETAEDGVNGGKIPFVDVEDAIRVAQPERPYE
ncbi:TIGR03943 family protein [Lentzea albidocapillata subsp. violacea]|uniref:TIGR03943 family protein n=1 Tax=Lentzea albidocapillata subsp. violacea TaxID=128104 RepID=A0A1G8TJ06_9PSEU|nr:TIGR03943 family protein [Lentzea albidocapillata]SDJ41443.1 TIGR03943 family protein [Lentzea albidocapillata subsp. violacea]